MNLCKVFCYAKIMHLFFLLKCIIFAQLFVLDHVLRHCQYMDCMKSIHLLDAAYVPNFL